MNTAELADHIASGHSLNKSQAKQVVEAVFAAIVDAAAKGDEVSVPGFGKFKVTSAFPIKKMPTRVASLTKAATKGAAKPAAAKAAPKAAPKAKKAGA